VEGKLAEGAGELTADDSRITDPRAYVRLAALIRHQIHSGALKRGSPAPSITSLASEHKHARQTCGKGYRLLAEEVLVRFVPGLGYFVT
jgi:DNA-binding transcriptional regulator YhcF (GntR family)